MKNKIIIVFTFLLNVGIIHAQYDNFESPDIPHLKHISVEALQWGVSGNLALDKAKKHHLGFGFATAFTGYGKDFNAMFYGALLASKLTKNISLSTGYIGGPIDGIGWVHGFLLGPEYTFKNSILKPRIRLYYNYLAFGVPEIKNSHRIRLRFSMSHPISKNKKNMLIFRTEPFVYKSADGAFKEIRTTIGPYFTISKNIGVSTLYENRWSRNNSSETIRHTLSISLNLNLDRLKD